MISKFVSGASHITELFPSSSTLTGCAALLSQWMVSAYAAEVRTRRSQSGQYNTILYKDVLPKETLKAKSFSHCYPVMF
jgi:hypothetical protein